MAFAVRRTAVDREYDADAADSMAGSQYVPGDELARGGLERGAPSMAGANPMRPYLSAEAAPVSDRERASDRMRRYQLDYPIRGQWVHRRPVPRPQAMWEVRTLARTPRTGGGARAQPVITTPEGSVDSGLAATAAAAGGRPRMVRTGDVVIPAASRAVSLGFKSARQGVAASTVDDAGRDDDDNGGRRPRMRARAFPRSTLRETRLTATARAAAVRGRGVPASAKVRPGPSDERWVDGVRGEARRLGRERAEMRADKTHIRRERRRAAEARKQAAIKRRSDRPFADYVHFLWDKPRRQFVA